MIIFSIVAVVVPIVAGTFVFFWGENLFWKGAGLYVIGNTLLWQWPNPRLRSIRAALHMPVLRAASVGAALYILAGVLMAVGAATRLHPIFAAFVIIAALVWIFLVTYLLRSIAAQPKTWLRGGE
jgi:hypothetical protein